MGKKYEPNELHPENEQKLSYQSGIISTATRTPKNYKFTNGPVYNEAIVFDKIVEKYLEKNPELKLSDLFSNIKTYRKIMGEYIENRNNRIKIWDKKYLEESKFFEQLRLLYQKLFEGERIYPPAIPKKIFYELNYVSFNGLNLFFKKPKKNKNLEIDLSLLVEKKEKRKDKIEEYMLLNAGVLKNCILSCNNSTFSSNNDAWIKSNYFGLISSRIYLGSDTAELVEQNFKYTFEKGSWSHLVGKHLTEELNTFTASSYASYYLGNTWKAKNLGEKVLSQ